jgi:hypothetical protein
MGERVSFIWWCLGKLGLLHDTVVQRGNEVALIRRRWLARFEADGWKRIGRMTCV